MVDPIQAQAPTVYEAIRLALGRAPRVSVRMPDREVTVVARAHVIATLLHRGSLGGFDLVAQIRRGRTLFVGEGDLSFSLALARLPSIKPKDLVSTTFETRRETTATAMRNGIRLKELGATVVLGVDGTRLDRYFDARSFETIIFNFPNVASRTPVHGRNPNHHLAKRFLQSASRRLTSRGRIVITLVDTPYYIGAFDLPTAAKFAGLRDPQVHEFNPWRFSGYSHSNTLGDGSALDKYSKFSAWVFRL